MSPRLSTCSSKAWGLSWKEHVIGGRRQDGCPSNTQKYTIHCIHSKDLELIHGLGFINRFLQFLPGFSKVLEVWLHFCQNCPFDGVTPQKNVQFQSTQKRNKSNTSRPRSILSMGTIRLAMELSRFMPGRSTCHAKDDNQMRMMFPQCFITTHFHQNILATRQRTRPRHLRELVVKAGPSLDVGSKLGDDLTKQWGGSLHLHWFP